MEQKKIGIAIIGAGAIADVHIKAYTQYPELCEVRAVCDLFPEKAEQLIQSNGLTAAKAYKDYKEAIASGCIDAVSICLPPQMHADIAVEALHSDCHVICEKPMACSLEECDTAMGLGYNMEGPIPYIQRFEPQQIADALNAVADHFGKEIFRPVATITTGAYKRG